MSGKNKGHSLTALLKPLHCIAMASSTSQPGTSTPHYPLPSGYQPPPEASNLCEYLIANLLDDPNIIFQFLEQNLLPIIQRHGYLTGNDVAALTMYTVETPKGYHALNYKMARRERLEDSYAAWLYHLVGAIQKLPKATPPKLYRGVPVCLTKVSANVYEEGRHVYFCGVTSCTTSHDVMKNFASSPESTMILVSGCLEAVSMAEFSVNRPEAEYVLAPNAHFVVKLSLPSHRCLPSSWPRRYDRRAMSTLLS
jgi:hypothetical protein